MNKNIKISGGIILACIIALFIHIHTHQAPIDIRKSHKYKTNKELKAEAIQKKLNKRAAGWSKPDKPSEYAIFHKNIRIKDGEIQSGYKPNYKLTEFEKAQQQSPRLKSASVYLNWIERGPGNVSGRTRGLIVDPDDSSGNTWYTGSVGGGIWKTTNAGGTWINLTPEIPNLATVCLCMSKSNSQIIYAGTGEGFGNSDAIIGDGIFKTSDKGKTWIQLQSTASNNNFLYVNRIVVDYNNENIVLAATNTSIEKSTDGGTSWLTVFKPGGHIQQIVSDPSNFNILYATVQNKGIVKSEDKGDNWKFVFDHYEGRIELAIAPSQPNTIYALDESSQLYISNNSGSNWVPSLITSGSNDKFLSGQGWYNNSLAVYPTNPATIVIGGLNVYRVQINNTSTTPTSYFKADTLNTASFLNFVNFGANYLGGGMEINTSKSNYTNIEIQFGKGKSQKAHRFYVPEGETSGVQASKHSYQNYVDVPFEVWDTDKNRQLMVSFRDQDRNGSFNLTQHDDTQLIGREYIWVNDVNYSEIPSPNITRNGGHEYGEIAFSWPVLAEGAMWDPQNLPSSAIIINRTEIYAKEIKSTALSNWAAQNSSYVHADIHNVICTKLSDNKTRIILANDGGVSFSDNLGITWQNPTNGHNTTQFYGVDKHPTENRYIGGLQDNGSWFSQTDPDNLSKWIEATGGDGFDAVWHSINPDVMISTGYYNEIYKSFDGGQSWSSVANEIADQGSINAPFVTQIASNDSDPEKLYIIGASGVTLSENFGDSWKLTAIPESTWAWSGSGYIESSTVNPDIVWAGSRMSNFGKVHVSVDGGKTFKACNNFKSSLGSLSGLATHPTQPETAYALFSFANDAKILRTTNLGDTWEDISGFNSDNMNNGFPDVATYCLMVMPYNTSIIWAGTEIGLFVSTDEGKSWKYANNGLPAVSIWEMKIRGKQIIVATHGRGIWTLDLPQLSNTLKAPAILNVGNSPSNITSVQFLNESLYDSVSISVDNLFVKTFPTQNKTGRNITLSLTLNLAEGDHKIQLQAFKDSFSVKSATKKFQFIKFNEAQISYQNAFDLPSSDFYGEGFSISSSGDLGIGYSIQTNHPYTDRNDISYVLKTPIIVKANNSTTLSYIDIPMIEQGEPNAAFGTDDFYDYAVVEGSKNGINWTPLFDGYDFGAVKIRYNKTVDSIPSSNMFLKHNVSLMDTFNENDTILIRFRLFSDPYTNGWGWIIDDIIIEHLEKTNSSKKINVSTSIYPIPCNNELNINLNPDFFDTAEISIYDLNGKNLKQIKTRNQNKIQINTSDFEPKMYILEIKAGNKSERVKFQVHR